MCVCVSAFFMPMDLFQSYKPCLRKDFFDPQISIRGGQRNPCGCGSKKMVHTAGSNSWQFKGRNYLNHCISKLKGQGSVYLQAKYPRNSMVWVAIGYIK